MLRLKSFEATNALSYRTLKVPLEHQGLVFLGGTNGSGKSTPWELMTHAVHGVTSKGIRAKGILCQYNPKDFYSKFEFDKFDKNYVLETFRDHRSLGSGVLFKSGTETLNVKSGRSETRDTRELVSNIMGLSLKEWYGTVYLSQKYTHDLIEGGPSEKQAYLIRLFGLSHFENIIKEIKERTKKVALTSPAATWDRLLEDITMELAELPEVKDIAKALVAAQEKQKDTQERLSILRQQLAGHAHQAQLSQTYNVKKQALDNHPHKDVSTQECQDRIALHSSSIGRLAPLLAAAPRSTESTWLELHEVFALKEAIVEAECLLSDWEADAPIFGQLDQMRAPLDPSMPWMPVMQSKLETSQKEFDKFNQRLLPIRSDLEKISMLGDVCITCLRGITPQEKLDMKTDREMMQLGLEKQTTKYQGMARVLKECKDQNAKKSAHDDRISALNADLKRDRSEYATIPQAKETLRDSLRQLREFHNWLTGEVHSLKDVVTKRSQLDISQAPVYDLVLHQQQTQEVNKVSEQLTEAIQEVAQLTNQKRKVEDLKVKRETTAREKQESLNTHRKHKVMSTLLISLKDLRSLKLHEANKALIQVLPTYLDVLFKDEDVTVRVSEDEMKCDLMFEKAGSLIALKSLSGGQSKKLGLAILFALAKLLSQHCNILICDEPYTHLDPRARIACYDILRDYISTSSVESIFVTSHTKMADLRYDQRWHVDYDGKFSTLRLTP